MRRVERAGSGLAPRLTYGQVWLLVESTSAEANKVDVVSNRSAGTSSDATPDFSSRVAGASALASGLSDGGRCSRRLCQRVVCVCKHEATSKPRRESPQSYSAFTLGFKPGISKATGRGHTSRHLPHRPNATSFLTRYS
ncbi:hypothetical protein J3F83DRAFT_210791 [Trichoderma novae-zelandiae]